MLGACISRYDFGLSCVDKPTYASSAGDGDRAGDCAGDRAGDGNAPGLVSGEFLGAGDLLRSYFSK